MSLEGGVLTLVHEQPTCEAYAELTRELAAEGAERLLMRPARERAGG